MVGPCGTDSKVKTLEELRHDVIAFPHVFVNVGFNSIVMVCKHCGCDQPPQGQYAICEKHPNYNKTKPKEEEKKTSNGINDKFDLEEAFYHYYYDAMKVLKDVNINTDFDLDDLLK
jgi:hypothetical protein